MKAILLAAVVMVVVALGADYGLNSIWGQSSTDAYKTDNVRLN